MNKYIINKEKLDIFREKIEQSPSKDSYLRYSTELKLIDDVLNEKDVPKELIFQLEQQKQTLLDTLYEMGYKIKV